MDSKRNQAVKTPWVGFPPRSEETRLLTFPCFYVTAEQLGQQLRLEAAWREGKSGVKFLILVKMKLRLKGDQWPANNH